MKHIASLSKAQPATAQLDQIRQFGRSLKGFGGFDFPTIFFQRINNWVLGELSDED